MIQAYNKISHPPLDEKMKANCLQLAICNDICLIEVYTTLKQTKITTKYTTTIKYDEFFIYIQDTSALYDLSSPLITAFYQAQNFDSSKEYLFNF